MMLIIIMRVELKCVLHLEKNNKTTGKIIAFTEESLRICREKKEYRDSNKKKKSKFDEIVLPPQTDGVTGYHSQCYRYFCCSVKKPQSETLFQLYFEPKF